MINSYNSAAEMKGVNWAHSGFCELRLSPRDREPSLQAIAGFAGESS